MTDERLEKALEFANFGEDVVKETLVKEGTWRVPETKSQLNTLVDMLAKPYPATKPSQIDKFIDDFPMGDDGLYDDPQHKQRLIFDYLKSRIRHKDSLTQQNNTQIKYFDRLIN